MISIFTAVAALGLLLQSFAWQLVEAHGGEALRFFGPKWVGLQGLGVLAGLLLVARRRLVVPRWSVWPGIAVFAGYSVLQGWINGGSGFWQAQGERLAFLSLLLFFFQGFVEQKISFRELYWPSLISAAGISAIGLVQFWEHGLSVQGKLPYFQIGSTMGHANNTAQWIGVLLALALPTAMEKPQSLERTLGWGIVAVSLLYVFLLRGRSVWLALVLWGALLCFRRVQSLKWMGLLGGGLALTAVFWPGFITAKASAFLYRWKLWSLTSPMVAEKPMGWGIGQFEFSHLPFIAGSLGTVYETPARSAHNEFLRIAIEEGVPVLVMLIAGMILVAVRVIRAPGELRGDRLAAALLGVLILVECLFQFPFQNPWITIPWALLLAWSFSNHWGHSEVPVRVAGPIVTMGILALVGLSVRSGYAVLYGETDRIDVAARACGWQPSNWRACRSKGFLELRAGRIHEARLTFQGSLQEAPENYFAMRGLTEIALRRGRHDEACSWIERQNRLLREQSPYFRLCARD